MHKEEQSTERRRNHQPADMVNQEGKVQCLLLAIVVCNQIDRFHIRHEVVSNHRLHQLKFVPVPRRSDSLLPRVVRHEVVLNDFGTNEHFNVKFLSEDLHVQELLLRCVEWFEVVLCRYIEWQRVIAILELSMQAEFLGLLVEDAVAEEDEDDGSVGEVGAAVDFVVEEVL